MPAVVDKHSVKRICVDDFAIRKRFSYGTVMVDLESHRIIDIIPSRAVDDVKEWLAQYPNIEVVSRDGAQIYASATIQSHPIAMQVSDRFHLFKGLSEAVDKYLIRTFPAKIEITAVSPINKEVQDLLNVSNRSKRIKYAHEQRNKGQTVNEIAFVLHTSPKTVQKYLKIEPDSMETPEQLSREKKHALAVEQKRKDVEEARRMAKEGFTIETIAVMLHRTYKTIQNYLNPEFSLVNGHYNYRIPGKLAPYEAEILELRSQGITYPKIHEQICKKGYSGSVASLRMFVQKERTRRENMHATNSDYFPKEYIQRKALSQLIYKKIEEVNIISQDQYEKVLEEYPQLARIYALLREFYEIVFSKSAGKLEMWIKRIEEFDIPELQTYCNGLKKDIDAVKNGILYEYNNGIAEGSVNKIKLIKRTMYGRNSFEMLKAKVLFHEQFHCEFN